MYINTAGPNADKVSCDDSGCKGVDLTENGLLSCLQSLIGFRPDCPSKTSEVLNIPLNESTSCTSCLVRRARGPWMTIRISD